VRNQKKALSEQAETGRISSPLNGQNDSGKRLNIVICGLAVNQFSDADEM
jgi:hypothetical protein